VSETAAVRLDIWLWRARFFKTRSLASDHVKGKGARISRSGQTRRIDKPGTTISVGDVVTFGRGEHIRTLEILALGERRGPAEEAQALYRLLENDP
jgi:ribosome-associated heat shock protein Hsp15